jgi:hypothetical protein
LCAISLATQLLSQYTPPTPKRVLIKILDSLQKNLLPFCRLFQVILAYDTVPIKHPPGFVAGALLNHPLGDPSSDHISDGRLMQQPLPPNRLPKAFTPAAPKAAIPPPLPK